MEGSGEPVPTVRPAIRMTLITIKDLARMLNLSPSTVSRALRDHPDISSATKTRVMALADKMNYHPNLIAQSLQNRRSNTIGVIVPEIRHAFFSSAISGIENVAYKAGCTIMVCQSNEDYEREIINTRALVSHQVAGILISISQGTKKVDHLKGAVKRGLPLVFFDRAPEGLDADSVVVDDFDGAYKAVSHMINNGYTRIAHLAGPRHIAISRERYNGYKKALADNNLPFDKNLVVRGGFSIHDGYAGLKKLVRSHGAPPALFAINDPTAIGAYRYAREAGIKIPGDMALMGFSNDPISELIDPPLSTVNQPAYEMGRAAAGMLLERIGSEKKHVPSVKLLKTELVIRKSA